MKRFTRIGTITGACWVLISLNVAGAQKGAAAMTLEESIALALKQSVVIQ